SVKDVVESSNEDGVFTERQYETLLRCQAHLNSAKKNILQPGFLDAASQDIREALKEIDYLIGTSFSSELLDVIFSEFCVGK
ncbi:MAG: tRNA uridine-5-carboxymethylaminomethyl(34) synthesis GTPase MnmE, partial [Thermotogae bacterium]